APRIVRNGIEFGMVFWKQARTDDAVADEVSTARDKAINSLLCLLIGNNGWIGDDEHGVLVALQLAHRPLPALNVISRFPQEQVGSLCSFRSGRVGRCCTRLRVRGCKDTSQDDENHKCSPRDEQAFLVSGGQTRHPMFSRSATVSEKVSGPAVSFPYQVTSSLRVNAESAERCSLSAGNSRRYSRGVRALSGRQALRSSRNEIPAQ